MYDPLHPPISLKAGNTRELAFTGTPLKLDAHAHAYKI